MMWVMEVIRDGERKVKGWLVKGREAIAGRCEAYIRDSL